jgi:hypothetical protein
MNMIASSNHQVAEQFPNPGANEYGAFYHPPNQKDYSAFYDVKSSTPQELYDNPDMVAFSKSQPGKFRKVFIMFSSGLVFLKGRSKAVKLQQEAYELPKIGYVWRIQKVYQRDLHEKTRDSGAFWDLEEIDWRERPFSRECPLALHSDPKCCPV